MHYLPQEIEVWYLIPAIRKEISSCLINDFKVTYDEVGTALGISKAAVSQYQKGKRAAKIKLPREISHQIKKSCNSLMNKSGSATVEISRILKQIRDNKLPCEVCGKLKDGILEDCTQIRFNGKNYH